MVGPGSLSVRRRALACANSAARGSHKLAWIIFFGTDRKQCAETLRLGTCDHQEHIVRTVDRAHSCTVDCCLTQITVNTVLLLNDWTAIASKSTRRGWGKSPKSDGPTGQFRTVSGQAFPTERSTISKSGKKRALVGVKFWRLGSDAAIRMTLSGPAWLRSVT